MGAHFLCLAVLAAAGVAEPPPPSPYLRHCARCHGGDGGGRGPRGERLPGGRINEPGRLPARTEEDLAALILEGRKGMPGFKAKLGPAEARNLARQVLKGLPRSR